MKLTQLSISKPIAITMIVLLCVLLGIMGYINLGADLFPAVNIPVVQITSTYPGAGAEEMEKDVIKPIEDALSGISGLDIIYATAYEGMAQITVLFKMTADTSSAVMDTQKALDSISGTLPKDATRPTLYKFDDNAEPILVVTVSGDKPFEEIYNKIELLKERIERVQGVGKVTIFGGMKKELQIKVDKAKLDYYGLSISQIINKLQIENLSMPGGVINQPNQDKIVSVEGEFKDINRVKDFRIAIKQGFVRLSDVADISLDYPKAKELSRADGKRAIGLTIQKQSDANIVKTGNAAKQEIEKIKLSMQGMDLKIVQDSTIFITSALDETQKNLLEGILTTAIILFLFLRQWKSVLIVCIAIPTSLISTFFMMYFSGFTFNMLSLMGLSLCVGILVDDSVVVLENIHRHLKMGKDPKTAAIDGRSEIGMAAIAITLSDVVVFAPIAFMSGMVGQYFRQFGLVVVFATLFSLFVSFTITPMMASRMFKGYSEEKKGKFSIFMDDLEERLKIIYENMIQFCFRHRWIVVVGIVSLLVFSVSLLTTGKIGSAFMPYTDDGEFTVKLKLSPGATIEQSNEKAKVVENYVSGIKEKSYYYTKVGSANIPNEASVFVKLVRKEERNRPQKAIVAEVRDWAAKNVTGVDLVVEEASKGGEGGKPININVKGSKTEVINDIAKKVEQLIKDTKGTIEVGNSQEHAKPSYKIKVDKTAATTYAVTTMDVSNVIRSGIEGTKAGKFTSDGEDYDIKVKLKEETIRDENDMRTLTVVNKDDYLIPIGQVANISLENSPTQIKRMDKQRVASITANIAQGYTLGELTNVINEKLKTLQIPNGYSVTLGGEQKQMTETFTSLIQALILSILLVYMILVVLYESFLTPFVRILALPVGFIGALCILAATGKALDMMTMIGLIMLDGLAAKNGTILIDYTNTLMNKGMALKEALILAGKTRLKPILMTSFAMIMGMMPTALSIGDGSEFKSGMALVIIGGMITSTLLSPILLPVAYTYIEDFQGILRRLFRRKKKDTELSV